MQKRLGIRVRHRLGIVGWPAFAPVPHLLLLHQGALKITSAELNAFLNIFMHWQDASRFEPRNSRFKIAFETTREFRTIQGKYGARDSLAWELPAAKTTSSLSRL
jgi:hypothetical protein